MGTAGQASSGTFGEIAQEDTEGTEGGINASRFLSALIRPAATFSLGEKGDNGALYVFLAALIRPAATFSPGEKGDDGALYVYLSALIRPAATFSPGEKGDNGAL